MQNGGIPGEYHQVSKWWSPFENGANLGQSTLIFAWAVAPRSDPCPCLSNCLKRLHRLLFSCHGTTGSGTAPLAKIEHSGRWPGFPLFALLVGCSPPFAVLVESVFKCIVKIFGYLYMPQ